MSSTPTSAATRRAGSTMPATPTARPTRSDGRVFIKALRDVQPGRGTVLRLRPGDRRALHAEAEEGVRLPLRQPELPRHAAGAEEALNLAAQRRCPTADTCTGAPRRCGKSSAALLPGLSVEVVASAESTNTRLLERARISSGRRDAPDHHARRARSAHAPWDAPTPHGRRNDDTRPCLLVAEQQTSGRGRLGRVWHASAGASLTFSLALALRPPTGRACRWPWAWPWPTRWIRRSTQRRCASA